MPHKGWSCSGMYGKYDVQDLIYGVCPQVISALLTPWKLYMLYKKGSGIL